MLRKVSGREGLLKDIPTGTVGAIGEMVVAVDLMKKGYSVFRALSPHCFCDLVAYRGNDSYKIECRTGYRNIRTDSISFPKTIRDGVDIFAVYVMSDDKVYYFGRDGQIEDLRVRKYYEKENPRVEISLLEA